MKNNILKSDKMWKAGFQGGESESFGLTRIRNKNSDSVTDLDPFTVYNYLQ
jgi:hypothetical protein